MMRTVLIGGLLLSACSGGDTTGTSTDYEPTVNEVTFAPGCGAQTNAQGDCSYGFVMSYVKNYADLETTVAHETDNVAKTVDITVDTWSTSQVHSMIAVQPEDKDLGLLGAKPGSTYTVTVYDRQHVVLWSGKVDTLYHL